MEELILRLFSRPLRVEVYCHARMTVGSGDCAAIVAGSLGVGLYLAWLSDVKMMVILGQRLSGYLKSRADLTLA